MPRGGRRPGAGRKRKLTALQRWRVGARCQELWREEIRTSQDKAIAKATERVRREWERARSVPVSERADWLESEEGQEYLEDVEFALREDQQIPPEDSRAANRLLRLISKRPKGPGPKIVTQVASEFGLAERMVERCWDEFRKLDKR